MPEYMNVYNNTTPGTGVMQWFNGNYNLTPDGQHIQNTSALKFTVPNAGAVVDEVVITYYTNMANGVANNVYATFGPAGMGDYSALVTTWIGDVPTGDYLSVQKQGEIVADPGNPAGGFINYLCKISVPAALYGNQVYFTDSFSINVGGVRCRVDYNPAFSYEFYNINGMYPCDLGTYAYWHYTLDGRDRTVDTSNWQTATAVVPDADTGGQWTQWSIYPDTTPINPLNNAVWPLDYDSMIVLRFKIPFSAVVYSKDNVPICTVGDMVMQGGPIGTGLPGGSTIINLLAARSNQPDPLNYADTYNFMEPIMEKNGSESLNDSGKAIFHYDVDIRLPYNNAGTGSRESPITDPPVYTDMFDASLKLVGGSMTVIFDLYTGWGSENLDEFVITVPDALIQTTPAGTISLDFSRLDGAQASWKSYNGGELNTTGTGTMAALWYSCGLERWIDTSEGWWSQATTENEAAQRGVFTVSYDLTFSGLPPNQVSLLRNTARVKMDLLSGTLYPSAETSLTHTEKVINKQMAQDGARANIVIDINPSAGSITGGASPCITAIDTMSANLVLYLGTMEIQEYIGGSYVDQTIRQVSALDPATVTAADIYSYSIVDEPGSDTIITFCLPDSAAIRILYSAKISGDIGDSVDVSNAIDVQGVYSDMAGNTWTVQGGGGSSGGSKMAVTILKQDGYDQSLLEGAQFALYGPSAAVPHVTPPVGVPDTIDVKGTAYYFYEFGTTNAQGKIILNSSMLLPDDGLLYALDEITPPLGYKPLTDYILFSINGNLQLPLPAGVTAAEVRVLPTDNMTLDNEFEGGIRLPDTGGRGKFSFTVYGVFLIALAALIWFFENKNSKQKTDNR